MVSYRFSFRLSMVATFILFLSCANPKKDHPAILLKELTISQTHKSYIQGDFTAVQLVTAYLNRIDSLDGKINAITFINKDAIAVAKKLDNEFAKNEMESLLERYTYTTADEESDKPNPTHLVFKSKSLRKSLSDHKTALNHYRKFHLGIRP